MLSSLGERASLRRGRAQVLSRVPVLLVSDFTFADPRAWPPRSTSRRSESRHCGLKACSEAGLQAEELREVGFLAAELKPLGYEPSELRELLLAPN